MKHINRNEITMHDVILSMAIFATLTISLMTGLASL